LSLVSVAQWGYLRSGGGACCWRTWRCWPASRIGNKEQQGNSMYLKTQRLRRHSRTCSLMKMEMAAGAAGLLLVLLVLSDLILREWVLFFLWELR
jgi:hypothetical protein